MAGSYGDSLIANFLAELRRRRVFRVIVLYAIVGWVVIEVAATMLPGLHLPEWSVTLVIALVVLGFPLAVFMGWVFDVGPHGIERTVPAADAPPAGAAPVAPAPSAATADKTPLKPNDERRSIAVLPFVNMSGDAHNEYFSDGIAEEILNLLAKLPQLKVASRTSSFNLKGEKIDIPTAARQLGVATILEGSVRRAGEHVRITAQLIEADSDSHLWSETYDREMKDVFAIQDDIAQSIVKALQLKLTPQERRAIQFVATGDAAAYDYYLRGRNYMYSMARRDYEHAISMFEEAIKIDSKYALAYAGMADAYSQKYRYVQASADNLAHANRASEQAVALDPDSAEAHASRGLALVINEQYADAHKEFETAVALNPTLFEAWFYHGLACAAQGKFEQSVKLYLRASEVNPADYQTRLFLAQSYASLGMKQDEMRVRLEALGKIDQHIRLNPHDTRALYCGALNLYRVGEKEKAVKLAEQALRQDQDEPLVLYNVACFYVVQGNKERALDLLDKAVEMGFGDRAWIETDSDLEPLHGEERFKALLARIH